MSHRFNPSAGRMPMPAPKGFSLFPADGRQVFGAAGCAGADPSAHLPSAETVDSDLDETMAAPLGSDATDTRMDAPDDAPFALVEAWLPLRGSGDMPFVGQRASITLAGRGRAGFAGIDGIVIAVLSDHAAAGRANFSHVQILTDTSFFLLGNTYHPLVCGVAVQVALCTENGSLPAVLATVQAWPD